MTALIRRRCYEVVGYADESLTHEDWDLWLRISRHFKFKFFRSRRPIIALCKHQRLERCTPKWSIQSDASL